MLFCHILHVLNAAKMASQIAATCKKLQLLMQDSKQACTNAYTQVFDDHKPSRRITHMHHIGTPKAHLLTEALCSLIDMQHKGCALNACVKHEGVLKMYDVLNTCNPVFCRLLCSTR